MARREAYRGEHAGHFIVKFIEDGEMIHSRMYVSAWFADRETRNWLMHNGYMPIPQKRIEEHSL